MIDYPLYTECSRCGYRKWCKEIDNVPVCSACDKHGTNPQFIKMDFKLKRGRNK